MPRATFIISVSKGKEITQLKKFIKAALSKNKNVNFDFGSKIIKFTIDSITLTKRSWVSYEPENTVTVGMFWRGDPLSSDEYLSMLEWFATEVDVVGCSIIEKTYEDDMWTERELKLVQHLGKAYLIEENYSGGPC